MTTILHVIQQIGLGGASRALLATAKYSSRTGPYRHRAISLAPAEPAGLELAAEAGVDVVADPSAEMLRREMADADIVQVHWWNNAVLQTVLHWDLPPMRLMMWYHVAGDAIPQVITPALFNLGDLNVATNPWTYHELPLFRDMPESERSQRAGMVYDAADFSRLEGVRRQVHDGFRVGYVGTVDSFKMHPNYVTMSASIRIPDARFVVCGTGEMAPQLQQQARRMGVAGRFEFLGYVQDTRPVLGSLDVFGYPLCENTYASGELTIQEAMYAGLPVVAFPYGGVKSLVVHGKTGLLVHTEREYQQAIEHLYHTPNELTRLRRNAESYARENFGAENAVRQLNPLYEKLLANPKRSRAWGAPVADRPRGDTIQAQDLNVGNRSLTGGELFVESLGHHAGPFAVSMSGEILEDLLAADQTIAAMPRLIQHTGIFAYRLGYPQDPWLTFWAGLGELETGEVKTALDRLGAAIQQGFPHWRVYWHLARAAARAGQRVLALEALQMVKPNAPDFAAAKDLWRELTGQSDFGNSTKPNSAKPSSSPVAETSQQVADGVCTLAAQAQEAWQRQDGAEAQIKLQEALALSPEDAELHLALGTLLIQTDHPEQAWEHLQQAAENNPGDHEIQMLFAQVSARLGRAAQVETTLGRMLEQSPGHAGALRLLALTRLQSGQHAQAARACVQALNIKNDDLEALSILGHCFAAAGDREAAELTCQEILKHDPDNAEVPALRARFLESQNMMQVSQVLATCCEAATARSAAQKFALDPRSEARLASLNSSVPIPVTPSLGGLETQPALAAISEPDVRPAKVVVPDEGLDPEAPLISILVSTCNAASYLPACLEDLERQTIARQCEILVIDSGSEQNERSIVEEFQKRYDNIRYVRTERETLYAAWNRGLAMARGAFVTNANTDDAHRPDALEIMAAALKAHPEADLAYCDAIDTSVPNASWNRSQALRTVRYPEYDSATALFYCPLACHPMWRRSVFEKIGEFDPSYHGPGDYEFFLRFVQAGLQAVHVPEALSLFYKNPSGLSFQSLERSHWENERLLQKYRGEIPIERLFRVESNRPEQLALAWTAMGNRAACHVVPWFDNPQQDLAYARQCYQQALRCHPGCEPAIYNSVLVLALAGQQEAFEAMLKKLPPDMADHLRQAVASGYLELQSVDVPPARTFLEHGASTQAKPLASGNVSPPSHPSSTPRPDSAPRPANLRWIAPLSNASSHGQEARAAILALDGRHGVGAFDQSNPYLESTVDRLPAEERERFDAARKRLPLQTGGVAVLELPAPEFAHTRNAQWHIGYTWSEAGRIPDGWVGACNTMDEVWVPSGFHMEAFANSGVIREKLHVIPGVTREDCFDPKSAQALALAHTAGFRILAAIEWSSLSNWETLIASYFQAFQAGEDVCLYLRAWLPGQADVDSGKTILDQYRLFLRQRNWEENRLPRVEFITAPLPVSEEASLYRAMHCLAAPSKGEGSGRVLREAMMMALPVIGTGWGGFAEHLDDSRAWKIDYTLQTARPTELHLWACRGHQWACVSQNHLSHLLRHAFEHPAEVREKGRLARLYAQRTFGVAAFQTAVDLRLQALANQQGQFVCPEQDKARLTEIPSAPKSSDIVTVEWEGSFLDLGSLSQVNRRLTERLREDAGIDLICVGKNSAPQDLADVPEIKQAAKHLKVQSNSAPDITVRHGWPPDWRVPASGAWVLIQPWEFGVLPAEWVEQLRRVDEVWVPSHWVRQCYLESGVAPGKVRVVPNGVDQTRFHPQVPPLPLPTSKSFKFLFVGGTIHRKGPDILLEAYRHAFTAQDDVCLVIKDFGGDSFYAGQTFEQRIQEFQQDPNAPEIVYWQDNLAPTELPGLYTACDCLVHPYRGEGFGLPILEAMASGLPVVVTGGGASDDFATDDVAYRLPARRQKLGSHVSGMALAHQGWLLEPCAQALTERMLWIVANADQARALGQKASETVREYWTWDRAAAIAGERLRQLAMRRRQAEEARQVLRAKPMPPLQLPEVALLGHVKPALAALDKGDLAKAWRQALECLQIRPFHPEAYLVLGRIARQGGNLSLARRCGAQAKTMAPGWKEARQFLKSLKTGNPSANQDSPFEPDALPESLQPQEKSRRHKLTVCLITRNEEAFLGQCLESVRSIADQIVVVDTGSTDWTCTIAARFGAEIHHQAWTEDFSAARNAALARARGDWVLMLDADEQLGADTVEKLEAELSRTDTMAWRLPIVDRGRESEGVSYVPRLYRNAPGLFYVGRIHEQVYSSLEVLRERWGLDNRLGQTRLIHHGYSGHWMRDRDKVARNLRLLEKALDEIPHDPNLLLNHGLELVRSGHLEEGIAQYREAFHVLSQRPVEERVPELVETLLAQLSSHLLKQKDFAGVQEVLQSNLATEKSMTASLHFTLGLAQMELKQYAAAIKQMNACLAKRHQPALTPLHPHILTVAPRHCLAICHWKLDQRPQANSIFTECLEENPRSQTLHHDYALFLADAQRPVEALQVLHRWSSREPGDLRAWIRGGQIALSQPNPDLCQFACDWTQEAIKLFPHEETLLEQRAEALLLAGRLEASLPIWERLLPKFQPRSTAAWMLCRIALCDETDPVPVCEKDMSQEFLKWYQRLIRAEAHAVIYKLNDRLSALAKSLPTAAARIRSAIAEAENEAAV